MIKKSISIITAISLTACGGGSGSEPNNVTPTPTPIVIPATIYTGIFIDSAVENLQFKTANESGYTNAKGEFSYQLNEKVTFSIGDIEFPEILANTTLTPLELFNTNDINSTSVVNMLRLLQSLDDDGDPDNGIKIPSKAHELAKNLTVDFSSAGFDQQVADLVLMSGAVNSTLISAEQATYHFQLTLNGTNNGDQTSCAKTHSKVGYSGNFQTFFHNVSGTATIIDDCTIEITNFSYDGGGPQVYVYAGSNHDYLSNSAFAISQNISGIVYENDTLTLRIPVNKTLDDLTGLSVWCSDFNADFGHMTFTP